MNKTTAEPFPLPDPTGTCFCGCGRATKGGSYFVSGHDKKAEGDLNAIEHGDSIIARLVKRGFHPEGRNLHEAAIKLGVRERCGFVFPDGSICNVSGAPGSPGMRNHRWTHKKSAN